MSTGATGPTVLGVLHPGQMGAAVGAQARTTGTPVLWCPAGRSGATAERAGRAGLGRAADLADLLGRAGVVLSVCPPAVALEVAGDVARAGFSGVYVEANAVSPARARQAGELLGATGATFVDGGIIGPPPGDGRTARLYLAGPAEATARVAALFDGSLLTTVVLDHGPPAASALKMAYASYQKSSRVLAALAHALARHHDVAEHLRAEAGLLPGSALADVGHLPSVAARAWRWAPELREIAATLEDAGLPPETAAATAETLSRWADLKDAWDVPLAEVLDHLRR
jgi:3-hydroxyisobutyrate dehydrogenase-like beta-hydroxyacid dehydrogenase